MLRKKVMIPVLYILLLLSLHVSAYAAPPLQGGDEQESDNSLHETLDFGNLGTIMSGKDQMGDTGDGMDDGSDDGTDDGSDDGANDGADDGSDDGADDGADNGSDDGADDGTGQHPVANAIANYFDVPYDEIMDLHEAGNGFGTITKAYFFAPMIDGMDPEALLNLAHTSGWGNVLKDNGLHPGLVGNGHGNANVSGNSGHPVHDGNFVPPGQAKKTDATSLTGQNGQAAGGGNGRGNGQNNGGGNGHGVNGQPNGNGHGGGNGGGHGGGNGKGKGRK